MLLFQPVSEVKVLYLRYLKAPCRLFVRLRLLPWEGMQVAEIVPLVYLNLLMLARL